jgi:signal peptidase complex subunit 1
MMLHDIKLAVYVGLAGTACTFLVVTPPWPFYNKRPLKWRSAPVRS